MNETPDMLERAFDLLSAIPYLRKIMLAMWIFSTTYSGSMLFFGIALVFSGKAEFTPEWIRTAIQWVAINPLFALMFYLWNKREKTRKSH